MTSWPFGTRFTVRSLGGGHIEVFGRRWWQLLPQRYVISRYELANRLPVFIWESGVTLMLAPEHVWASLNVAAQLGRVLPAGAVECWVCGHPRGDHSPQCNRMTCVCEHFEATP